MIRMLPNEREQHHLSLSPGPEIGFVSPDIPIGRGRGEGLSFLDRKRFHSGELTTF